MWKSDKYHGPGIFVAKNKFYYSGYYENGVKKVGNIIIITGAY